MRPGILRALGGLAVIAFWAAGVGAAELPGVPVPPHYVLDDAELLNKADTQAMEQLLMALRNDEGVPLVVMTTPSVMTYRAEDVEELARKILAKWTAADPTGNWARGGLILVAKTDRKARIQLGSSYQHTKDSECDLIMQKRIVAKFKTGAFSVGVRGGTEALAAFLSSGSLPLDVQQAEATGTIAGSAPKVYSTSDTVIGFIFLGVMFGGIVLVLWIVFADSKVVVAGSEHPGQYEVVVRYVVDFVLRFFVIIFVFVERFIFVVFLLVFGWRWIDGVVVNCGMIYKRGIMRACVASLDCAIDATGHHGNIQ